jgi:hypothetical protein
MSAHPKEFLWKIRLYFPKQLDVVKKRCRVGVESAGGASIPPSGANRVRIPDTGVYFAERLGVKMEGTV